MFEYTRHQIDAHGSCARYAYGTTPQVRPLGRAWGPSNRAGALTSAVQHTVRCTLLYVLGVGAQSALGPVDSTARCRHVKAED